MTKPEPGGQRKTENGENCLTNLSHRLISYSRKTMPAVFSTPMKLMENQKLPALLDGRLCKLMLLVQFFACMSSDSYQIFSSPENRAKVFALNTEFPGTESSDMNFHRHPFVRTANLASRQMDYVARRPHATNDFGGSQREKRSSISPQNPTPTSRAVVSIRSLRSSRPPCTHPRSTNHRRSPKRRRSGIECDRRRQAARGRPRRGHLQDLQPPGPVGARPNYITLLRNVKIIKYGHIIT